MTGRTVDKTVASTLPLRPENFLFICDPLRPLADRISFLCFPSFRSRYFDSSNCPLARSWKMMLRTWNNSWGAFFKILRLSLLLLDASFFSIYTCCRSNLACFKDKCLETIPTNLWWLLALQGVPEENLTQWTLLASLNSLNRRLWSFSNLVHKKFALLKC